MKTQRSLTALSLILALQAPLAWADGDSTQQAIEYRQAAMTLIASNVKPMGAMLKGKQPFDQQALVRHAKDIAAIGSLDLLRGFPEESEGEDSSALSEIWFDWDDFVAKMGDFQSAAAALGEAAATGDKDQIAAKFKDVGGTCKVCHKKYKE